MPGLRHAHTLQQLKEVIEYSPPGEYLNNLIKPKLDKKNHFGMTFFDVFNKLTIIPKEGIIVNSLVVVVCEHGVSPALKDPEVLKSKVAIILPPSHSPSCSFHRTRPVISHFFLIQTSQSLLG